MKPSRRLAAACAAYLGTFLATLDISIVNVALPTIQTGLHTNIAGLQWVVNAYAICLAAFMLSAGPVADRHGHKRVWLGGGILFTVGSALCGFAPSLSVLLVGRAVQGVAAAFLISGAMPILIHLFADPKQRAHVIGGWSAFTALALLLGPLLGGLLLHSLGWQSIFLINLPLGLLATGLGLWGIPERRYPDHAAVDPAGQVLSIFSLGALAYGMIEAGDHGFLSTVPLTFLMLALVGFTWFVAVEKRVQRPLLPVQLFRNRLFVVANFASFILGFSYYSSLFFFSIFLQQIQGWSAAEAGWRMMPQFVTTGCMSLMFGRLSVVAPTRWLMVAGYSLTALSMIGMAFCTAETSYGIVALLFGLLGAGAGLAVPATGIVVMSMAPAELSGSVSATMNALRQAGMTIGIALLGTLMSNQAIRVLAHAAADHGISDAAVIARQAIAHHRFPETLPSLPRLYTSAMESGFHVAMLCAGLSCIVALILLTNLYTKLGRALKKTGKN
ncbi:MFS transporter [Marinobacterium iners]|uniref:Drug resistance transporter, EmrB/QacA subfamily n=1 Tax=Marinobacterium iners DSM 11526 TaxID=1122198 RepID=A0A1H4F8Y0_9GAMM|nr:MFS transporter [Marinobacterium iners]SEA93815.1 drug resistance transporter, EmrB/QacA subfamily [Marinobacterium iners DSM 11526]